MSSEKLRVVHSISSLQTNAGTTTYVVELIDALSRKPNIQLQLLSKRCANDSPVEPSFCLDARNIFDFRQKLQGLKLKSSDSIAHIHGIWNASSWVVALQAKRLGIKSIWSTHGMLAHEALAIRPHKKKLVLSLFLRRLISGATCLHATSQQEADIIRAHGFKQPILVSPPGLHLPELTTTVKNTGVNRALYLSRIHPIKNLRTLLQVWATIRPNNWQLTIAGPDEANELHVLQELMHKLNLQNSVCFLGPQHGMDKLALLRSADLFILPSFTENFGIVVAEALANQIPVLTTTGTPWRELIDHQCGWWVDCTAQGIEDGLKSALASNSEVRKKMGERGRNLIRDAYLWSKIAEQMYTTYHWLLKGGSTPKSVI